MNFSYILRRPIITEKSSQRTLTNQFIFEVDKSATKGQIKQAIEAAFPVKVVRINTMIMPGKSQRRGKLRRLSPGSSWKKAVIKLKPGDKIDLFETKGD